MVPVRVQVTSVESRVSVVLVESLPLPQVDPRVVLPQPVAILHPCLPGRVHQLWVRATFIALTSKLCRNVEELEAGPTNLGLHEPPLLSTAPVARLEKIGRVDGDAAFGVKESGEMVPGAESWRLNGDGEP